MLAWYNDNELYVRRWLQNLRAAGHIPQGYIDDRPIQDVEAEDLEGYRQAHFFAGIAGWPLALELAKWPKDREVWTGSCPCQPFSIAGQGKGIEDERHVWPKWLRLITKRRPATIFGEQVASPLGREWLAGVRADLEALGYAVGAADLCAASAGSPQIRQRLWWVASSVSAGRTSRGAGAGGGQAAGGGGTGRLGHTDAAGPQGHGQAGERTDQRAAGTAGGTGGLGDSHGQHPPQHPLLRQGQEDTIKIAGAGVASFWSNFDLVPCSDSKSRRVEPGSFPLAHGVPNRVGRLCAYGNAIVPQVAAEFVTAFMETEHVA